MCQTSQLQHFKKLTELVFINKNKDFVESLRIMNIFEETFEVIEEELQQVEEFIKENGKTEGKYLQ